MFKLGKARPNLSPGTYRKTSVQGKKEITGKYILKKKRFTELLINFDTTYKSNLY